MRRGLALTACPISNSYVAGSLKAMEIRRMLERGMRVTVNSDDPTYFPGYMNENLVATQEARANSCSSLSPVRLLFNLLIVNHFPDQLSRS